MKGDAKHIAHVETGAYPLRAGNQVEALVDGEKAFRAIVRAVAEARQSVWLTVAFLKDGFEMPDGHGSLFDVLDRAVERGLDVRVIFWRSQPQEDDEPGVHFLGTRAQRQALAARRSRFKARWTCFPASSATTRRAGSSMLARQARSLSWAASTWTRPPWWRPGIHPATKATSTTSTSAFADPR